MRFSVLASGSTGNSIYVETEDTRLLIDAGVSGKQIEEAMAEIAVSAESLDAILVTHEHVDHIKGVGVMARKYQLPVYATAGTWKDLHGQMKDHPMELRHTLKEEQTIELGSLVVESFEISHDCKEPVGYCFHEGDTKLTLATDLGYVSQRVKEKIIDSNAYIMEANYDVNMLRIGPYPWHLKRRILGDKGHLSNEAAADALVEMITHRTRDIFLAHLSQENNLPELADITVRNILQSAGICTDTHVRLHRTYQKKPTPLCEVVK